MIDALLLLVAPSRESRDKAAHFAAAAKALGLSAQVLESADREQIMTMAPRGPGAYALACSDAMAHAAARLNEDNGHAAFSPALAAALADKATGLPLLGRLLGLPPLPQLVPLAPDDLRAWQYDGPLIVKPCQSSGSWSPRPWGYRRFPSARHFLDWLTAQDLAAAFFLEQQRSGPLGPNLLQAAIDSDRIELAAVLLNSAGATLLCRCEGQFEPAAADQAGRRWQRGLYHAAAAPDLADRLPSLSAMIGQASGWGTGILHVQGMRSDSGFHLTDINLRLPSTWDWLMAALDPSYHRRLLASLLFGEPFDPAWPAPAMAIDLVHGPKGSRLLWIDHAPPGEGILPWRMRAADCSRTRDGFDAAGQAASFIAVGGDAQTCNARADTFRAAIRLEVAP
ncbi:MAG: hypothetical protein ACK4FK_04675 [Ferrovibrio sp.]|jgi:hypothetical protein|uniref:hypothetical protein n=1 Tax=Ferrovibrio sp. TaxID=1917215 RepID=UPI00391A6B99